MAASSSEEENLTLEEVSLSYDGYIYTVSVDRVEANKLRTDGAYASQFSKMLVEQMGQREQLGVPSEALEELPCEENVSESSQVKSFQLQSLSLDAVDVFSKENKEADSSGGFTWTKPLINLLIETRASLTEQFSKAIRKKKLWEKVAHIMTKTSGQLITADACDAKWRNLLACYRKNKDKKRSTGAENISWEFFSSMDEMLHSIPSSSPPPERLSASMSLPQLETGGEEGPEILPIPSDLQPSISGNSVKPPLLLAKRKRKHEKPPDWVRRLQEIQAQHREDIKKETVCEFENQNRRWEEQMAIEKKKVETLEYFCKLVERLVPKDA